jgi:hypothetical protein
MRCDTYERHHWEHEEELLIARQAENRRKRFKIAENNYQPPSAAFTPRPFLAFQQALPPIPPPPERGIDDLYDDVSPIGSNQSLNNSSQSDGHAELLHCIEDIAPKLSTSTLSDGIGSVSEAMNAFYEALRAQSTGSSQLTKGALTTATISQSSATSTSVRVRTSPRLNTQKVAYLAYNPYIGKDYEAINEMLHSTHGYQTGGFFARENFNVREAKKDLIYLNGIKKGDLLDDPENTMIGFWKTKLIATLRRDGNYDEDMEDSETSNSGSEDEDEM